MKVLRWVESLSDTQIEELVARISMACESSIEAEKIRQVFRDFLRVTPNDQRKRRGKGIP